MITGIIAALLTLFPLTTPIGLICGVVSILELFAEGAVCLIALLDLLGVTDIGIVEQITDLLGGIGD
jgi:hypothetical protein